MSQLNAVEKGLGINRSAVDVRGWALLVLSFQTLGTSYAYEGKKQSSLCTGIIYSDIGTSPLYVLNGIWSPSGPVPSKEDVIGGISAIFWSLTLLPLCKYVSVCIRLNVV